MDRFDPVRYSLEENEFLLANLGKPPVVALTSVPPGVISKAVRPILEKVYEFQELASVGRPVSWVGIDALKERITTYLTQAKKWADDKKRFPRAPRFPSMHSYDGKNRPHRGGPGSDSGQVRTYFDERGERKPFAIDLFEQGSGGWVPEWATNKVLSTKELIDDVDSHRLECPICKHTESYNTDSRGSYNAARARMSKHLRTSTLETDLHRELHTNEFGS